MNERIANIMVDQWRRREGYQGILTPMLGLGGVRMMGEADTIRNMQSPASTWVSGGNPQIIQRGLEPERRHPGRRDPRRSGQRRQEVDLVNSEERAAGRLSRQQTETDIEMRDREMPRASRQRHSMIQAEPRDTTRRRIGHGPPSARERYRNSNMF
jgi:hypothetical protein